MRDMGQGSHMKTRLFSLAMVGVMIGVPAWGQVTGADYRAGSFAGWDARFDTPVGGVLLDDPNGCDPNPMLTITITTDAYGGETTWELRAVGAEDPLVTGGPYLGYTTYVVQQCLLMDECYEFRIFDSYGDGMHAPGGYRLKYNDLIVASTLGIGWSGSDEKVEDIGPFGVCEPGVGACCVEGECVETDLGTYNECRLQGGVWIEGETCETVQCPPPPACPDGAVLGQPPYDADDSWIAGRSEVSQGQRRLENFTGQTSPVTEVHWWGLFGTQDAHGWYECADDPNNPDSQEFRIGLWHDDGGQPGPLLVSYEITAQATLLDLPYPPFSDGLILFTAVLPQPCPLSDGWISIEGMGSDDCWFLWMNSPDGDGVSYLDTGTLQPRFRNLSLCLLSEYEPVYGSCCEETTGTCTDNVETINCVGIGLRFTPNVACADLSPECGDVAGACCFADGECLVVHETMCAALDPADCNCDGAVDFDDIDYFVAALGGETGWSSFYASHHGGSLPTCPFENGDVNRDGSVDFDDIDPFVLRIGAPPLMRVWLGRNTTCDECPCLVDCPSGAEAEDEPCMAQLNEGCAVDPPAFDVVACGDVICGTLGSDAGSGQVDTDWYAITLTADTNLTLSLLGQPDPISVGVAVRDVTGDPNCLFITDTFDPIATTTDCEPTSVTTCLPPGTHYINVSTPFDPAQPCPLAYVLEVDCAPCVLPVGACCVMTGDCVADQTESDCAVIGGVWLEGETCGACPMPDPGSHCWMPREIDVATDLPYDDPNATTCGWFNWHSDTCLGDFDEGQDVVYRLTVTESAYVEITLNPQETAFTGMLLTTSCPPGETCLASFKSAGTAPYSLGCLQLMPGEYYLVIDSIDVAGDPNDCIASYDLSITDCTPPVGRCCIGPMGEECVDNLPEFDCLTLYGGEWTEGLDCSTPCPIPVAETCAEATAISGASYLATFDNDESTADGPHGSCDAHTSSGPMQNDVWFAWTAAESDVRVFVTVTPTDYDAIVAVRDGCVSLQELACADGGSVDDVEVLDFAAAAGITYYIQVGDSGSFEGGGMTQIELTTAYVEGACCFDGGVCEVMTPAACILEGGEYVEDGTGCIPNPCAVYCDASGGCDEYIGRVEVGTIDWTSGCDGYGDFTAQSTTMQRGTGYGITVTLTDGYLEDQCAVWVDWNQDAEFDEEEKVTLTASHPAFFPFTGTITPPTDAALGETRLRIRLTYDETPVPCGVTEYGEAEDYTVEVVGSK
jgi:hypothetical protein